MDDRVNFPIQRKFSAHLTVIQLQSFPPSKGLGGDGGWEGRKWIGSEGVVSSGVGTCGNYLRRR